MAKLVIEGLNINETNLNALGDLEGGPIGTSPRGGATLTVSVSPTSFSYIVNSPRGDGTTLQGTGDNLVYDDQNRPIGGTITSISGSELVKLTGGPLLVDSYQITEISIDASSIKNGTFGDMVFAGDDEVEIEFYNGGGFTSSSSVSTSGGDDNITISAIGVADFGSNGGVEINSGAGNDTITLPTNFLSGTKNKITTGDGNDTIAIVFDKAETITFHPDQLVHVPTQTITDFDVSNDKITFSKLTPNDGWQWQVLDLNGSAEIRAQKLDVNGQPTGELGARIIVQNVSSADLDLGLTTPPTPTGPVFGTDAAESLLGDAGDNILIGLGGDDALIGFAGNDVLIGGEGNDSLDAGDGNDQLFGEAGDDQLYGGAGDDALFGGLGNDFLVGDADGTTGIDGIFGGEGNDVAFGGNGDDYIEGNMGDDSLLGESGDDEILGGDGNDFIDGGANNDLIMAGQDDDIVLGGLGDDRIFGDEGNDSILGQEGDDVIKGGLGNDTIDGGDGNDALFGNNGDDTIFGGLGRDKLYGADGNDNLFGGEGKDSLFGAGGNDTIFAGIGNDFLDGSRGNDVLFGEDGDDIIWAGSGIDVVNGGAGADIVVLEAENDQIFWQDFEDGTDIISFSGGLDQNKFSEKVIISATADGNSTLITYEQTQLFLENVNASLIDAQDFNLVETANLDDFA